MEKHAVARLIGAPPGYVGYEEGGHLTEAVRRRPYSVVLFDEIEKAHPDVFHVLLQILEDGRLTDGKGRVVDFKNTLVIMTSNLAGPLIQSWEGRDRDQLKSLVEDELKKTFRPEFLNRIDEVVLFHNLTRDDLLKVVDMQVARVGSLLQARQLTLQITPALRRRLAEIGYDPQYGARPLKRTIQRLLLDALSRKVLEGTFGPGDVIRADWSRETDDVVFEKVRAQEVAGHGQRKGR